jgi:hypothetical protein
MSEFKAEDTTRRELLKKGAFVGPVILTLVAAPSFASAASGRDGNDDDQGNSNNQQD